MRRGISGTVKRIFDRLIDEHGMADVSYQMVRAAERYQGAAEGIAQTITAARHHTQAASGSPAPGTG